VPVSECKADIKQKAAFIGKIMLECTPHKSPLKQSHHNILHRKGPIHHWYLTFTGTPPVYLS